MQANEAIIRKLYAVAEGANRNTAEFVSLFTEDGYFYDVPAGRKYYGQEIGIPVDAYASAFPDMHRELFDIYIAGDIIVVELALQGTHLGDLHLPGGTLDPTGKRIDVPCCDVFHLKDGKVTSFHCYNAASVLLQQLGALGNLEAALKAKSAETAPAVARQSALFASVYPDDLRLSRPLPPTERPFDADPR